MDTSTSAWSSSKASIEKVMPEVRSVFLHALIHLFNKYSWNVNCLSHTVISSSDTKHTHFKDGEVRKKSPVADRINDAILGLIKVLL